MAALKQEEESISEIQNYLDTFNKEIEDPNQIPGAQLANKEAVVTNEVETTDAPEDGGTYFVDQSGQYYYQSNDVDGGDGTATLVAQDGGTMVSIPNTGVSLQLQFKASNHNFNPCSLFHVVFNRRRSCASTRRGWLSNSYNPSPRIFNWRSQLCFDCTAARWC